MKKNRLWLLVALLLMLACGAQAEKARGIKSQTDATFHAAHIAQHIGWTSLHCTGNTVKIASEASGGKVVGKLEPQDVFEILDVQGTHAEIRILRPAPTSKQSEKNLTGWVSTDYIDCACKDAAYRGGHVDSVEVPQIVPLAGFVGTTDLTTTTYGVRVRNLPEGDAILGHLNRSDRFVLETVDGEWAKIRVTDVGEDSEDSAVGMTGWVHMDYLLPRPGKTAQSAMSAASDSAWKQDYLRWLLKDEEVSQAFLPEGNNMLRFALLYIDADDVPELLIDTGIEATGCQLLTWHNGQIDALQTNRLYFTYVEHGNLLCNAEGNMGVYFDDVYAIEAGRWTMIAGGMYELMGEPDGAGVYPQETWIWNRQEMTREGYQAALAAVYPQADAKEPPETMTAEALQALLSA